MTTIKIGFIGLGKLGMPCAEAIAKKGVDVTGFDIG
jgi:UDP-N-acetyl-D-mannosaminuronate dehydrogenase